VIDPDEESGSLKPHAQDKIIRARRILPGASGTWPRVGGMLCWRYRSVAFRGRRAGRGFRCGGPAVDCWHCRSRWFSPRHPSIKRGLGRWCLWRHHRDRPVYRWRGLRLLCPLGGGHRQAGQVGRRSQRRQRHRFARVAQFEQRRYREGRQLHPQAHAHSRFSRSLRCHHSGFAVRRFADGALLDVRRFGSRGHARLGGKQGRRSHHA
jgi:hypothetical protein